MPPNTTLADVSSKYQPWIFDAIELYNTCSVFNEISLPEIGGVMDQNTLIVQILKTIHSEVENWKEEKREDAEFSSRHKLNVFNNVESDNVRKRS